MKPNIDLTLRRDFKDTSVKKSNKLFNDLESLVSRTLNKSNRIPWRKSELSPLTDENYKKSDYRLHNVFIMGNKHQRQDFKDARFYYVESCERCGIETDKIIWRTAFTYKLCRKCYNDLRLGLHNKVIWRKK